LLTGAAVYLKEIKPAIWLATQTPLIKVFKKMLNSEKFGSTCLNLQ
jgi:hypothetical protein